MVAIAHMTLKSCELKTDDRQRMPSSSYSSHESLEFHAKKNQGRQVMQVGTIREEFTKSDYIFRHTMLPEAAIFANKS